MKKRNLLGLGMVCLVIIAVNAMPFITDSKRNDPISTQRYEHNSQISNHEYEYFDQVGQNQEDTDEDVLRETRSLEPVTANYPEVEQKETQNSIKWQDANSHQADLEQIVNEYKDATKRLEEEEALYEVECKRMEMLEAQYEAGQITSEEFWQQRDNFFNGPFQRYSQVRTDYFNGPFKRYYETPREWTSN